MEYLTISVVFVMAVLCIWCYNKGIKVGMGVKNGKPPEPVKLPHMPTKEEKELKEMEAQYIKQIMNIANYQPEHTKGVRNE